MRPTFDRYGAKVTFFVSAYHTLNDEERGQLRALADDGHDIQYHSTNHENAADVAASEGVGVWIERDIVPDLAAMRADGYPVTVFAYPFGSRSAATDAAVLEHVTMVRGSNFSCPR
jgi:peptidoglycan-N-acetylglucosamine deacetylase